MIIDFHTHIFSPAVCSDRGPWLADRHFGSLYESEKARLIDHVGLLDAMRSSGIERAVAMGFPWESADNCSAQNDYFRAVREETGGAILPFGSIPPGADIRSWARDIRDAGLAGIGEVGFYRDGLSRQNLAVVRQLLAAARDEGLPLCLHVNEPVGHSYPGKYEPSLGELYSAIADHPGATVILSHWGGGLLFYELMPEVSRALAGCYYDTAASPYLYSDRIYGMAMAIVGARKIVFGSDYPLIPPDRYLEPIGEQVADSEARELILGGNASRILKISG